MRAMVRVRGTHAATPVVLLTAPEVYDEALATLDHRMAGEIGVLVLLPTFLGLLCRGCAPALTVDLLVDPDCVSAGFGSRAGGRPGIDRQAGASRPSLIRG